MKRILFLLLISIPLFGQIKQKAIQRDSTQWIDSTLVALKDSLSDHNDRINTNVDSLTAHTSDINSLKAFDSAQTDSNSTFRTELNSKFNTSDFNSTFDIRLGLKTTDDLTEGSNLYYTDARVNSVLSTFIGTSNITTLGIITTGTWQASIIGDTYLTKTGNWTGTFDGQEGTYYLDLANSTGDTDDITEGSTNFYYTETKFDTSFNQTLRERDTVNITNAYQADNGVYNDAWGNTGGGYKFDGVDDEITVTHSSLFDNNTNDFTIVLDMLIKTGSGIIAIGKGGNDVSTAGFEIIFRPDNDIEVYASDGTVLFINTASNPLGQFTHDERFQLILIVDRNGLLKQYYNSKLQGSVDISSHSVKSIANTSDFKINRSMTGICEVYSTKSYNKALTQLEVENLYGNGLGSELSYEDIGASQTDLLAGWDFTSGWVTSGITVSDSNTFTGSAGGRIDSPTSLLLKSCNYSLKITGTTDATELQVQNAADGTIYSSISNANFDEVITISNVTSTASIRIRVTDGTSTTTDISAFELRKSGCVAEYKGENMGRLGAIETQNGLHGSTSGSPISLSAEQRTLIYRDVKIGIANTATTLTDVVPYGYQIKAIRALGSNSLTGVKVGTSSGGEQIVASTTVNTAASILTLAGNVYDETSSTTLYAEHATAAETLDLIFLFEKLGN